MATPPKGNADFLALGDYNAICDRCGRKFKASTMMTTWEGYKVCPDHWEARQPQDFARGVPDIQSPPWTRTQIAPDFVGVCTLNGLCAVPGFAMPGCAIPNFISPSFDPNYFQ